MFRSQHRPLTRTAIDLNDPMANHPDGRMADIGPVDLRGSSTHAGAGFGAGLDASLRPRTDFGWLLIILV